MKSIWKNRYKILSGLYYRIFKSRNVEKVAAARKKICEACPSLDRKGKWCMVPGTNPCCAVCGCSIETAIRSLSYSCPNNHWSAVMTEQEENELNAKLGV